MENRYNIKATTVDHKPYVLFEYEEVTEKQMQYAIKSLPLAFREIEITNAETGEVIFTQYTSEEIFCPAFTPTESIDNFMLYMAGI